MSADFKKCLICKSGDHRVIFSYRAPDKYESAVGVSRTNYFRKWVQCRKCGFYYALYSRGPKILDRLYAAGYRDRQALWRKGSAEDTFRKIIALPKGKSETKFRVAWIKKSIADIWKQGLVKQAKPPYRFLDIGGGAGIFAYEFRDAFWRPSVIDPDEDSRFIREKLKIPLAQTFYQPGSFSGKFTLISLNYVLEHLTRPVAFLKSLRRDMHKDSFLYLEVPDALCFRFLPKGHDIFNACHLWMFDPNTLTKLLDDCGFEVFNLCRIKTIRGHYALMALSGRKLL